MPTLVFMALALSGLAALVAGSGALALALLGAAVAWGFLCGLVAVALIADALLECIRRGGGQQG